MGFTKFRAVHQGGQPWKFIRITTTSDGVPLLVVIPTDIFMGCVTDELTVDVMLGHSEDAGAFAITKGTTHKVRRTTRFSSSITCGAAIRAACGGAPACRRPRYELRDGMLVVWPAQEAVIPGGE